MRRFAFAALLACTMPAMADGPAGPLPPVLPPVIAAPISEVTMGSFGRKAPLCKAWSNQCVLCTRVGDAVACSTPGIACTPKEPACTDPKAPE